MGGPRKLVFTPNKPSRLTDLRKSQEIMIQEDYMTTEQDKFKLSHKHKQSTNSRMQTKATNRHETNSTPYTAKSRLFTS